MNWREKVEEILKKCWGLLPLLVVLICVALVKAIEALTGDTLRSVPSLILMGFGICSVAVARQYPPYFRRYSPSGFGCSFENHHPHPVVCAGGVLGGHERSGNACRVLGRNRVVPEDPAHVVEGPRCGQRHRGIAEQVQAVEKELSIRVALGC